MMMKRSGGFSTDMALAKMVLPGLVHGRWRQEIAKEQYDHLSHFGIPEALELPSYKSLHLDSHFKPL